MTRMVCQYCGVMYRDGEGPESHGICPECWAELEAAEDDELAEVHRRLIERRRKRKDEKV